MLAHALTSYACRYGVLAGQSCVIATCHDGSYDDAIQLAKMGMQVTLIDSRLKKSLKYDQTQAHDISVLNGMVPVDVIGNRLHRVMQTIWQP